MIWIGLGVWIYCSWVIKKIIQMFCSHRNTRQTVISNKDGEILAITNYCKFCDKELPTVDAKI